MRIELVLTILGVLLTILFGIISYARRNKAKISFYRNDCFSLFDSIVKRFDKVEIKYNNNPIDNTLILLNGFLVNNGKSDIDKAHIHKSVQLKTSENYKWVEANVDNLETEIEAKIKIDSEQEIHIDWDLLKPGEFIQFTVLAEKVDDTNENREEQRKKLIPDFVDSVKFDHRITNAGKINHEKLLNSKSKPLMVVSVLVFLFYFLGGAYFISGNIVPKSVEKYEYSYVVKDSESDSVLVVPFFRKDNIGIVKDNRDTLVLSSSEFNEQFDVRKIQVVKTKEKAKRDYFELIFGLFLICISPIVLVRPYRYFIKFRKFIKTINNSNA